MKNYERLIVKVEVVMKKVVRIVKIVGKAFIKPPINNIIKLLVDKKRNKISWREFSDLLALRIQLYLVSLITVYLLITLINKCVQMPTNGKFNINDYNFYFSLIFAYFYGNLLSRGIKVAREVGKELEG